VFDVRRALDAALAGLVLHPLVLGAIGLTLEAAQRVDEALHQPGTSYPALLQLASGLSGGAPAVQEAIYKCIQVTWDSTPGADLDCVSSPTLCICGHSRRRRRMCIIPRGVVCFCGHLEP
jgi:hypothetical protein